MSKKNEKDEVKQPLGEAENAAEETAEALTEAAEDTAEDAAEKTAGKPKKEKPARTSEEEAERALNKVKRRKKLKYGTLATVITIVFIAIVVVANVILNVLDKRYNWNIDLTSSGRYQIDEQTIGYLNQLNTDVQIAVMADEDYFNRNSQLKVVQETLNRFQAEANGHISVEYIDMAKNPDAVKAYQANYSGEFSEADVVVKHDDLVRAVSFDDIIKQEQSMDYSTYSYVYNYTFIGEQSLISAIMGVTDLNPISVAVIDLMNGAAIYNEADALCYQRMAELLSKNNYNTTEIDISTEAMPEDCTVAILCSPSKDLSDAQIQKLSDFLYNGGKYNKKLIYFASPYQSETPKLDEFLEVWGIKVGANLVRESNDSTAQFLQIVVARQYVPVSGVPLLNVSDSEMNASFVNSKVPLVGPYLRDLTQLYETNSGRTTEVLLSTADTAYLVPLDATGEIDPSTVDKASYPAVIRGRQTFSVDNEIQVSELVAFGSAWFLDYNVTLSSSYDNSNYFISLLNTMTGKENVLTIAEKSLNNTTVSITDAQVKVIRNTVMLIIPLIVAIIGVVVYFRRRNK